MSNLQPRGSPRVLINGMKEWCRNWRGANSRAPEMARCEKYEIERIASDLGVSVSELRKIADHGPEAADLLLRRMAVLNLEKNEIAATAPSTYRDLQRLCTLCANHKRCAQDLGRDAADPAWEDYCPNVAMLKLLDSLPWTTRAEW